MRHWPATRVYYLRQAVASFNSGLIFTSIWTFYYETLRLNLAQIALIFIVITVTGLLLEVPTGVIADSYSRRLSVIVGGIFIGLCYTGAGLFPIYAVILLGALLEAIGDTCVSGALDAWIADEVGAEHVGPVFARSIQVATPSHWVGVLLSIALAARFDYQMPIAIGGISWLLLTVVLIAVMPETFVSPAGAARRPIGAQLGAGWRTFREGLTLIRTRRAVLRLMVAGLFSAALLDSFYRFSRLQLLTSFALPVVTLPLVGTLKNNLWFGLFEVAQGALTFVGLGVLRRAAIFERPRALAGALVALHSLMLIGVLAFAGSAQLAIAIGAWLAVTVFGDLARPLVATWLNQSIDSSSRATVLSIHSQVSMLGMLTLSSALSVVGDGYGVRPALALASVLLLPVVWLYARRSEN